MGSHTDDAQTLFQLSQLSPDNAPILRSQLNLTSSSMYSDLTFSLAFT
jgi:hypothetical protein